MWGAIIGAATGAVGQGIGAIVSARKNKKARKELDKQRVANQNWYDRRYNEDYLNTAEAQHALSQAREAAMTQLRNARGVQAVMGGSDEAVAAAQINGNQLLADTESKLAAQGQARKDAIENQYLQRAQDISNRYAQTYGAQAANAAQAGSGAMQAGLGLVSADMSSHAQTGKGLFGDMFKKRKVAD